MDINIYSFFSGVGFLDLGFEHARYKIQLVNEYNEKFLSAYQFARRQMGISEPDKGYFNCDINYFLSDDGKRILERFVQKDKKGGILGFVGGPPCPDFSIAGRNEGITGINGRLTTIYKKVILKNMPDFFMFENVKGLWSTKKHREEYDRLKNSIKRKGYLLVDRLVNSLEYGVPQDRERIILFGIHKSIINIPPKELRYYFKRNFNWGITPENNLERIKNINFPSQNKFVEDGLLPCPEDIKQNITIEYWFRKNDVYNHPNSNDFFIPRQGIEKMRSINEGDVTKKSFKRLHRWRYSPTVAYGNNEVHLHPYKCRRISVAEALSIQSLPKEFIIAPELSLTDKFKVIGNGVPYLMSNAIALYIEQFLQKFVDEKIIKER